jgi:hypothetical protein
MASKSDTTFGHRVFVIDGERVVPISQKAFHDFYQRDEPSLKQFAGRTVDVAVAFYTLNGRKPKQIIRMDTMRIKVTAAGSVDPAYRSEALRLAVNAIHLPEDETQAKVEPANVIDARKTFDRRRGAVHHPKLSGPVHKKILDTLFK